MRSRPSTPNTPVLSTEIVGRACIMDVWDVWQKSTKPLKCWRFIASTMATELCPIFTGRRLSPTDSENQTWGPPLAGVSRRRHMSPSQANLPAAGTAFSNQVVPLVASSRSELLTAFVCLSLYICVCVHVFHFFCSNCCTPWLKHRLPSVCKTFHVVRTKRLCVIHVTLHFPVFSL